MAMEWLPSLPLGTRIQQQVVAGPRNTEWWVFEHPHVNGRPGLRVGPSFAVLVAVRRRTGCMDRLAGTSPAGLMVMAVAHAEALRSIHDADQKGPSTLGDRVGELAVLVPLLS